MVVMVNLLLLLYKQKNETNKCINKEQLRQIDSIGPLRKVIECIFVRLARIVEMMGEFSFERVVNMICVQKSLGFTRNSCMKNLVYERFVLFLNFKCKYVPIMIGLFCVYLCVLYLYSYLSRIMSRAVSCTNAAKLSPSIR